MWYIFLTFMAFGLLVLLAWETRRELQTEEDERIARSQRNYQSMMDAVARGDMVYVYELPDGSRKCYDAVDGHTYELRRPAAYR